MRLAGIAGSAAAPRGATPAAGARAAAAARRRAGAPARAFSDDAPSSPLAPGTIYDATFDSGCRNAVVLTGNVGQDLELRQLSNGMTTTLSLAVPAGKDKTSWFRVDLYSPLAEQAAQRVRRGTSVVVHGYMREDKWVDKTTGQNRSAVKVVARTLGVLARRPASDGGGFDDGGSAAAPAADGYAPAAGGGGGGYAAAAPGGGGGGGVIPDEAGSEVEAQWLSVIREPQKWWDNRMNKKNPKAPDYKSKEGSEALWITSRNTPGWVTLNLPPPRQP
ncbi:MAG: hypothetical protein J3K34DRAFT_520521 [Monoraphidium minutum]|nr:MAG: hypothetical protein J3K34DRAFT_520521 [Monoraphidium minutum]